jgi:hypothetical protein
MEQSVRAERQDDLHRAPFPRLINATGMDGFQLEY